MTFLSPLRLWLLLAVVLLAAGYVVLQFRRKKYAVRFTNTQLLDTVAPKRPGWRRHVPATIFLLALSSMVVAFAQPARDVQVPRERATVIMALDTSLSMAAEDVEPSRFEAAKDSAKQFADLLPPKINLGLVTFDGTAVIRVNPTTDRAVIKQAIDKLELNEATAIGDAIVASLASIETVLPDEDGTTAPARIILMSDGETTVGTPEEDAIAKAQEAEVPVSTIAFGTAEGFIEIPEEPFPIPVPPDEEALQNIADQTEGAFFSAGSAEALDKVYEDIGTSVGYETEQREITVWFVGLALALMMATAAFSLAWFSRLP
jgi:Ca-activated chloride channel family protein